MTSTQTYSGSPTQPESPKKRPIYRRGWFIGLMIVALIVVIAAVASSGGGSSTSNPAQPSASADSESSAAAPEDGITMGQKNALQSAKNYLAVTPFSRDGLVNQLVFDKYSEQDAAFAADNVGADWNEQAAKKARQYLDVTPFSRDGLIHQLVFEGFTQEQAEYGVDQVGL